MPDPSKLPLRREFAIFKGILAPPTGAMTLFGVSLTYPKTKREWRMGAFLFIAYLAATRISAALFVAPAIVFPAAGIALGGLFLEGIVLWPFVYLASVTGYILNGSTLATILILPVAHTLQAVIGAWLLRRLGVDPIFRRTKDMFSSMLVFFVVAAIVPTIGMLPLLALNTHFFGIPPTSVTWGTWYTGMLFSLLFVAPFVMRWFAKTRFTRTLPETLEVVAAFGVLLAIVIPLFWFGIPSVLSVSLIYLLLVPLFWIALRLRPRFITLALFSTAGIALAGSFWGPAAPAVAELGQRIFQLEVFLCIIAFIFYVLVSLEEERRMTTNLLTTQVGNLRGILEQLSSQNRAKTEFIAMLAHELRNPLAPVVSALELLRARPSPDQEHRETLDLMDDRMKTVRRLLDDLLDVSRITEQKLVLQREVVALSTLVRRAAMSAKHYFAERDQRLTIRLPESELIINADPVRIEQVITNLLTNAAKYSNLGETVTLAVRPVGEFAEITVTDTGVGIDADMQKRIFEPFLQVELGHRTRQGLGIGLALVRNLVELHDGTVQVASDGKDLGSTFTVMLPITHMHAKVTAPEVNEIATDAASSGNRVLVVDDNDAAAWSIGKLLELQGCVVDYAYDGAQALKKARTFAPRVILLDIGLPDRTGHDVGAELRESGFTGILIAVTGYSQQEERDRATTAGFDHYLVKPIGLADLKGIIGC